MTIGDAETERMNQMESRSRHGAQPAHVAGVLGDLRLEQHDLEHGFPP
jgi:hypothetical protein